MITLYIFEGDVLSNKLEFAEVEHMVSYATDLLALYGPTANFSQYMATLDAVIQL